jgi:hypothetical protein
MDTDPVLPGNVLVDLYIRLRDECDNGELSLDPNHKVRSAIVMAILGAAETISDLSALEASVRLKLGQPAQPQPLAA